MKIAMSQITTLPSDLEVDLPAIAAAGFRGVELSFEKVDRFLKTESVEMLRDRLDALGLEATGAIGLAPQGPALLLSRGDAFADYLASFKRQLAICRALGVPVIGIGADAAKWAPDGSWQPGAAANLRAAAILAEDQEMRIALEFMSLGPPFGPFILDTLPKTVELAEEVEHTALGISIDFFHHFRSGGEPAELALLRADQIAGIHVTDVAAVKREDLEDRHRVLPGEGVIDLKRYRRAVSETGYDGYWTLELLNEDLWQTPPEVAAQKGWNAMDRFRRDC